MDTVLRLLLIVFSWSFSVFTTLVTLLGLLELYSIQIYASAMFFAVNLMILSKKDYQFNIIKNSNLALCYLILFLSPHLLQKVI
ncbi:hypothetical protein [Sutcliffiella cohnii]|uniref:hypothetical protein n=1 Tax=Sutcliffiella cohnii TaxID=33932 RepID=UPI00082CD61C|nr:hypothetical protein [Sutcliffiella cohnii]